MGYVWPGLLFEALGAATAAGGGAEVATTAAAGGGRAVGPGIALRRADPALNGLQQWQNAV